jgi:subtilisin family serine protease
MKSCRFPQFFTLALLAFATFGFVAVPQVRAEQFVYFPLDTNPGWNTEGVPTRDELAAGKRLQAYSQGLKAYPNRSSYSSPVTFSEELSLTTLFASNNGFAGNMFDLQVNEVLTITRFEINIDTLGSTNTIEIYYRLGTCVGHESSPDGWILLGSDTGVVSNGTNNPTPVNIGGLMLGPGQVYGFYVNLASYPSSDMRYTDGGPTVFSNAQMSLTTNCGKGNPAFTGDTFFPRQWNGTIYYTIGSTDDIAVTPSEGFVSSGDQGGPFTPSSKTYTLTNTGPNSLDWTAEVNVPWLDAVPNAGTLLSGQNTVESVSINANANGLTVGSYSTAVTFTNLTSGVEQVRAVSLTVNEIPPPPPPPHDPNPADGAVLVDINTLLQWNGGGGSELQNGGFETGDFTGWTIVTGPGGELQPWTLATSGSGSFGNGMPFEGTYFAQNGFDGEAGLYYDIYQEIAISGGASYAQLEWSERLQWDTTYGATIARPYEVTLQSAGGGPPIAILFSTTLPPGTTGDTGYVTHFVDLLAAAPGIAGQTVRINFHQYIPETYTGPAQFDLDGVSLTVIDGTSLKRVELGRSSYNKASPIAGMYPSRSPLKSRSAYLKMKEKALASKVKAGVDSRTQVNARQQLDTDFPINVSNSSFLPTKMVTHLVGGAASVLVFDDSHPTGSFAQDALNNLGIGFVDVGGNQGAFDTQMDTGIWDLVIYDMSGDYINQSSKDRIMSYIASGGRVLLFWWDMDSDATFCAAFEAAVVTDFFSPLPVFGTTPLHSVWTTPNIINLPLDDTIDTMNDNGDILRPIGGGVILGSFTAGGGTTNNEAMVLGNSGRTILHGFSPDEVGYLDGDGSGKIDRVELYENEISFLLGSSTSPTTYDVYFDTINPPSTLIYSGLTVQNCQPLPYPLDNETTYYWQIVASNSSGQTAGPVWSFTTIGPPGEIEVTDSIPPPNDMNMPFGGVIVNTSKTEHITIANNDPVHDLVVTDISLGGGYFEDFNDGLAQDWHEDIDQSWQVIAGEYRAQTTATDWMMANYAAKQWDDLSVQMTCRRTGNSGNSAAVTLRASSDFDEYIGSAYIFQIATNGAYSIWKQVNGSWSWLQSWTSSPSITTGTNTLTAVAEGSLLKFFINGTLVWTGSDSALVSGHIGLGGYTSSGDATHYFDNVFVGKPMTSAQIISDEQLWYNQHSYEGGEPQAAPKDWVPSPYPDKNKFQQQTVQKASAASDEAFYLENLPSLPLVIPPLGNVTFDVNFEPISDKGYQSSVVIKSNDYDEPEVKVLLAGNGIPDYLEVTPDANLTFSGHPGGPFLPSNTSYSLANKAAFNIDWIVSGPDWLDISPSAGTIKPEETMKVTVTPNAQARSKPKGTYPGQLIFTNITTTVEHRRNIILNIYTDPKVWITPDVFNVTVSHGSTENKILTIGNGGDGLLNFILRGIQTGFTPTSMPVTIAAEPMVETEKDAAAMAATKYSFTSLAANVPFAEGRLFVRFAPQTNRTWPSLYAKSSILAGAGKGKLKNASIVKEYNAVQGLSLVKLPEGLAVKDALAALNNTGGILYAEPDYQLKALSVPQIIPNDPYFTELWGLHNTGQSGGTPDADIDAPEAWSIGTGSSNIIVAIIDTGVDYIHPDLAPNMWVNTAELSGSPGVDDDGNGYIDDIYGYDFYNEDGDPMDDNYHGTHVAGTIGAVGNNGQGVAGVCWNVKIMALKFLDSGGSGYTADAIECIQYAILMGAKLSSNSWGGGAYSQALKDAIDAAGSANQLFIVAAGNNSSNNDTTPFYPASYTSDNIIAVLATDRYDNMSSFSNYGLTSVDIGAPGSDILSCQPGSNYQYLSGTSMATPHVSGAAALIWSFCPSMPYQQVKDILLQTADKIPAMAGRCVSNGRLNLYNAVNQVGASWLEFVPDSGTVAPGQTNDVTVLLHGDVPPGIYQGLIGVLSNDPYTPEVNIPVTMTVEPVDCFTELFSSGDNDLANRMLTFIPNGSGSYYSLCTSWSSGFVIDPAGGTTVTLRDDDYQQIQLQGAYLSLYGVSYDTFYIGSNGYITFVSGDIHYFERLSDHFALPRIAALFDDLNPSAGGTISYKQLNDRVAVTFEKVPEFSFNTTNTFQIEMFFDGRIRITYLDIAAVDGLAGISKGNGIPAYFIESNLSEYAACGTAVPWDFDIDGDVDGSDLLIFADNWQRDNCAVPDWCQRTDLDKNGLVNFRDFAKYANHWLEGI